MKSRIVQHLSRSRSGFASVAAVNEVPVDSVKPFESIPGPRGVPIFGNLLSYRLGPFSIAKYNDALLQTYQRYGPIVKEKFGSHVVVHIFDPEDARVIYANEGKIPYIVPLQETTQMYRQMRDLSLGLGNMNGYDWYRLRQAVQQLMMRPKEVQNFLPLTEVVSNDFVDYIEHNRDGNTHEVANFRNLVLRWSLESAGAIVFEKRLGCLTASADSILQQMIDANQRIFKLTGFLKFSLPIFRYLSTPKWRELVKAEDLFYGEAAKYVNETVAEIKKRTEDGSLKPGSYTFMAYLLGKTELEPKDVSIIALSLFGDGLNTTAPALIYNLYCLAKNPEVQEELHREIDQTLPPSGDFNQEVLGQLPYLKACVKETFRLFPVGTDVSRVPQKQLILSGYRIPEGTNLDINMTVHLKSEAHFKDPLKFKPERWLRGQTGDNVHPYMLLPFGFGPRMCAGRRFAEQDLYVTLSKIIRKFRVEHHHGTLEQELKTLLLPKGSTQFSFVGR